jgi:hypothetical protein
MLCHLRCFVFIFQHLKCWGLKNMTSPATCGPWVSLCIFCKLITFCFCYWLIVVGVHVIYIISMFLSWNLPLLVPEVWFYKNRLVYFLRSLAGFLCMSVTLLKYRLYHCMCITLCFYKHLHFPLPTTTSPLPPLTPLLKDSAVECLFKLIVVLMHWFWFQPVWLPTVL